MNSLLDFQKARKGRLRPGERASLPSYDSNVPSVACFSLSLNRAIFFGRRQVYRQRAARDAAVEQSIRDVIRLTSRKCRAQTFLASRNVGRWATFRDILDKSRASSTSGHRGGSPSANRIVRFGAFGADSRNIPAGTRNSTT